MSQQCYHCGSDCEDEIIKFDEKDFCCNGCKTVYEIFSENDLTCYYDLENAPGATPEEIKGKYDFLDNEEIKTKLLEFNDGKTQVINLYIPHIHCSSCIWILENLHKLRKDISFSQVNFPKKTVRITFNSEQTSLKEIVLLLCSIGYEPYISLEDYEVGQKKVDRSLIYKLGLAGFAFGNVMLMSFPEYFEEKEFWLDKYKVIFRWLMFAFSVPVVVYAASDYFSSAIKGLRSKILNIDVPIALGITVLFVRSTVDIIFDFGSGFFDSLTGLVFFLLVGRFFQQKTYNYLSFERDYKSYFPIAVTRIKNDEEENTQIYDIEKGDRILIRNQELIPVDGILINGDAEIDYSFVTGEAVPISKKSGDKIFAGGKQISGVIEIEVLKSVEQSYLTQLWSNDVFQKDKNSSFKTLTDRISKNFTVAILSIAFIATFFWLYKELSNEFSFENLLHNSKAINVFTSVLIIACPCAIALSAPFTLGNMLRIFGKRKFYLKNATVIEQLAKIDTFIFDKTGTLTTTNQDNITYEGEKLSASQKATLTAILRSSNHPLSRSLYNHLKNHQKEKIKIDSIEEKIGKGIYAIVNEQHIKIGSASFVNYKDENQTSNTTVYISFDDNYKGKFTFKNSYRKEVKEVFEQLKDFKLAVVSGDNEGEKEFLSHHLPPNTELVFNQKPNDKLEYVAKLQQKGKQVAMIGDGLNDAGALAQSDVGIALSENINVFSPACDGILDATKFNELANYINASKKAVQVIKYCFMLSFLYNSIGLYFAVTGQLKPVIAAILMPISSISIVVFTTVMTNIIGRKLRE